MWRHISDDPSFCFLKAKYWPFYSFYLRRRCGYTFLINFNRTHSSLESGSNPKVKTQPKFQWNLVWPCMLVEKTLSRKNSIGGPWR